MFADESLYKIVGARIRELRDSRGLTQASLASRVGLERSSIANIEAGKQKIPLHVLYRLAISLGVDVGGLLPTREDLKDTLDGITLKVGKETGQVSRRLAEVIRKVAS